MIQFEAADNDGDWPAQVRLSLAESRRQGLTFRKARVLLPKPTGDWRQCKLNESEESPRQFLMRHMEAAYHGVRAQRYCNTNGCNTLTWTEFCAGHMAVAA